MTKLNEAIMERQTSRDVNQSEKTKKKKEKESYNEDKIRKNNATSIVIDGRSKLKKRVF